MRVRSVPPLRYSLAFLVGSGERKSPQPTAGVNAILWKGNGDISKER